MRKEAGGTSRQRQKVGECTAQETYGKCLLTSNSPGSAEMADSSLNPVLAGESLRPHRSRCRPHSESLLPSTQKAECYACGSLRAGGAYTQAELSTGVRAGEGIQDTCDAGKNLTDPDEQVLGDLPPDRQWCRIVQVLPNQLRHCLVGSDVP